MLNTKRLENHIMKAIKIKIKSGKGKIATLIYDMPKGEKPFQYIEFLTWIAEELVHSDIRLAYKPGFDSIFIMITDMSDYIEL